MSRIWKRIVCGGLALITSLALLAGCQSEVQHEELLLAFSGDCQAYIEPCG